MAGRGGGRGERSGGGAGGPGERVVYGANPVRELLARRPSSIRVIWVDPQRAGRSTSDSGVFLQEGLLVATRTVPEPASVVLLALGLAAVGAWRFAALRRARR